MAKEDKKQQIINLALNDLVFFIKLVHPNRELGDIHKEVLLWMTKQDAKSHQLFLLPRDHQKSTLAAYYAAWMITKNPAIRILYISSTANLATKQLKFIKDVLTCTQYRLYWPEMVHPDEGKREKWTESEISVDHPRRKIEFIRDPTVFTAGLTTSIVGLHCDLSILDDVVVDDNSSNEEGRRKVRQQVSYLASIAGTDSRQLVVGTRYHPKDLYQDMMEMHYETYDDSGQPLSTEFLYETFQRQVETNGDGTGDYLWPRMQRADGKWFGFNAEILSKKKAQYNNRSNFRAQYYNDPNDPEDSKIKYDDFIYFDKSFLHKNNDDWYLKDRRLAIFAAVDFAYSTKKTADFTSIVVVGVDHDSNYYVLDILRFKTDRINVYFENILAAQKKWGFKKLRAEITAAQSVIVKDLKEHYIRPYGIPLVIDDFRPTKNKEDRMEATLQPKYNNKMIWHYKGGNCSILEEELVNQRPAHDDIKDSLASCLEICVVPSKSLRRIRHGAQQTSRFASNRFGGF